MVRTSTVFNGIAVFIMASSLNAYATINGTAAAPADKENTALPDNCSRLLRRILLSEPDAAGGNFNSSGPPAALQVAFRGGTRGRGPGAGPNRPGHRMVYFYTVAWIEIYHS